MRALVRRRLAWEQDLPTAGRGLVRPAVVATQRAAVGPDARSAVKGERRPGLRWQVARRRAGVDGAVAAAGRVSDVQQFWLLDYGLVRRPAIAGITGGRLA
jgi:hypothetical protein